MTIHRIAISDIASVRSRTFRTNSIPQAIDQHGTQRERKKKTGRKFMMNSKQEGSKKGFESEFTVWNDDISYLSPFNQSSLDNLSLLLSDACWYV